METPPPWVAGWLAGDADPDQVLPHAHDFPVAVKAALERYPPGCVARWAGPAPVIVTGVEGFGFTPELGQLVIVAHVLEHLEVGIVLLLLAEPDGQPLMIPESIAPLEMVGYRGGLTPEVARVLLRRPGGAAS